MSEGKSAKATQIIADNCGAVAELRTQTRLCQNSELSLRISGTQALVGNFYSLVFSFCALIKPISVPTPRISVALLML
jgi:hypothetical protein